MEDGWIEKMPLDHSTKVDVRWRGGSESYDLIASRWINEEIGITHWRLHKTEETKMEDEKQELKAGMCVKWYDDDGKLVISIVRGMAKSAPWFTKNLKLCVEPKKIRKEMWVNVYDGEQIEPYCERYQADSIINPLLNRIARIKVLVEGVEGQFDE